MPLRRSRGFGVAVVLVVLALVMIGLVAGLALSRLGRSNTDAATTTTRLGMAQAALEQFAGAARRLPCPANPAVDDGVEVTSGSYDCSYTTGTIPWKTIGLRRDDAFDAWGYKLSYRVYTGAVGTNKGSLVQVDGVNMTECDLVDPAPAAVTASGLCQANTDIYQRATLASDFLSGKGLTVTDMGTAHGDAAYVILSHGSSGYGAYTVSNVQMPMPTNASERANTMATGPFTIMAFSDPDTNATSAQHFDDLLAYRSLTDLVRRIGLYARDWPEGGNVGKIATALGVPTLAEGTSINTGTSSATFAGVTYRSYVTSGGTTSASNFSYGMENSVGGVGGVAGGGNYLGMTEFIRMDLGSSDYKRFAVALNNFGYFSAVAPRDREQVDFRFYSGGTQVGTTVTRQGCSLDGKLETLLAEVTDPTAKYDRVEIQPKSWLLRPADSSLLLISEFTACGEGITCVPQLAADANNTPCDVPALASTAFAPASVAVDANSTWTLTISPGTDNAGIVGMAFQYTLPSGLVFTSTPSGTCSGALSPAADNKSFSTQALAYPSDATTCTLTATVKGSVAGSYSDSTGSFSSIANVRNVLAGGTLTVTGP